MIGTMTSAATGSAHHHPKSVLQQQPRQQYGGEVSTEIRLA